MWSIIDRFGRDLDEMGLEFSSSFGALKGRTVHGSGRGRVENGKSDRGSGVRNSAAPYMVIGCRVKSGSGRNVG